MMLTPDRVRMKESATMTGVMTLMKWFCVYGRIVANVDAMNTKYAAAIPKMQTNTVNCHSPTAHPSDTR
jgi:hypothetical protein